MRNNEYLKQYQNLLDYLTKLTAMFKKEQGLAEGDDYMVDTEQYGRWLRLFYKMYSELMDIGTSVEERNEYANLESVYSETVCATLSGEGDLVVHLPRISKQKFMNSQFFVAEIRYALEALKARTGIQKMSQKLISVINVYSTDTSVFHIADNMNWDTKKAIDIMVDYTGGGDGGLNAFCSLKSFRTDEVEPGMYIIISPDQNKVFETEIAFLYSLKW